jgi:hypothetical protein
METLLLVMLAAGLLAIGVGVTFLIATRVPMPVLEQAQDHGRFAGLGSVQSNPGAGKPRAAAVVNLGKDLVHA